MRLAFETLACIRRHLAPLCTAADDALAFLHGCLRWSVRALQCRQIPIPIPRCESRRCRPFGQDAGVRPRNYSVWAVQASALQARRYREPTAEQRRRLMELAAAIAARLLSDAGKRKLPVSLAAAKAAWEKADSPSTLRISSALGSRKRQHAASVVIRSESLTQ